MTHFYEYLALGLNELQRLQMHPAAAPGAGSASKIERLIFQFKTALFWLKFTRITLSLHIAVLVFFVLVIGWNIAFAPPSKIMLWLAGILVLCALLLGTLIERHLKYSVFLVPLGIANLAATGYVTILSGLVFTEKLPGIAQNYLLIVALSFLMFSLQARFFIRHLLNLCKVILELDPEEEEQQPAPPV